MLTPPGLVWSSPVNPLPRVRSAHDGTRSQSGAHVTVRNASWNGTIGAGGSTSFGFDVAYSGAYGAPANCRLNGAPCDGSGGPGPDTSPPSVPGGLRSTGVTSSSVSLAWNASTDNVGVTGYDVYRGTTRVSTVTGPSATV